MVTVEEARDVEIGADILDHDVGRIAPSADRDIAIGQGEAFERGPISRPHDVDTGSGGEGQATGVDRLGPRQVSAQRRGEPRLTRRRTIGQLRPKRRARGLVDAQRGRTFGR